jgi:hypothetical protein
MHPTTPKAPAAPMPQSLRAMGAYLLLLMTLGILFALLGLRDPWLLAVQWASGLLLVAMAITLALGLWAIVTGTSK